MLVSALIAVAMVGLQESDSTPWQTYVSKDGQFLVDFPGQSTGSHTRTSNGPSGRTKVIVVEYDSPSVMYVAEKVVLSTAPVKGTEGRILDQYRDFFKAIFRGQVITEKSVRREAMRGRDFTIRGQPERRGDVATIRVRMYLAGPAIYALIAIAAPNRELPDDTGRFFGSFALGTKRLKKAGPQPEVSGTPIAGWGSAVDPDGDCEIKVQGKALSISVPGTLHDLNADIDKYNAPRVLREVSGDFTIDVKVVGEFKPGPKSLNPKSVPYNGAGIFVWRDSDNFIRLERAAIIRGGKLGTFATFEEREGGSTGAEHNGPLTPGTTYLHMERRGKTILGMVSKDGKNWTKLRPIDTVWPAKLKVGVNAINSSNEPFVVRFEDFKFQAKASNSRR
jgi:regulation of enolase protein 1 (concanavalin A-like superfamily)